MQPETRVSVDTTAWCCPAAWPTRTRSGWTGRRGVRGKRLTSWPSLQTDLRNAGAEWVDEEVVVDGNLVTSRNPDNLPAFTEKLVELIGG